MKFWVPWGIAAIVTGVAVYFFFVGLADGTVSSFNGGVWMLTLFGTFGVTGGSLILKQRGRPGLGALLALVLAVPGLIAGLLLLMIMITQPRWN
ncbi:MAG: osmoprotectant transporter permease [Syntrophobacteraceae bacterium]